ncbi:hypothetical protein LTR28_008761 [Elasticomyces elasticus]|nr:hypothetical protein LTR28_008761 [Elasticomyces elasticus]
MPQLEGNALLYTVTTLTCLGFFLIGFDNGLMGGLVNGPAFDNTFGIDTNSSSGTNLVAIIVAIYEIGCFIGAICTSFVGEKLGRRKSVLIGVIIMMVGALLQATAYATAHMIVARIVSGIGMGFINSTVPVIQAEFSPKATRGMYVCAQLSTLNAGIMLVYWIDYAFSTIPGGGSYTWRIPIILQCIFLVPMILIVFIIPETPRWLVAHSRDQEALDVLRRLNRHRMSDEAIVRMHNDIANTVAMEASIGAGKCLMAAVMVVQTALIYQVQYQTSIAHASGIGAAAMLFIFQGAFTIGFQGECSAPSLPSLFSLTLQAIVWVYPSEILPLKLRQRGSSVSTAANWICNFIIVYITPPAIRNIGYRTYIIFAVLNAIWVPIIYVFFPETKNMALEDVDRLFGKTEDIQRRMSAYMEEKAESGRGAEMVEGVKGV